MELLETTPSSFARAAHALSCGVTSVCLKQQNYEIHLIPIIRTEFVPNPAPPLRAQPHQRLFPLLQCFSLALTKESLAEWWHFLPAKCFNQRVSLSDSQDEQC